MKLIVEEYNYKSELARKIIEGFNHKVLKEGVSTDCVGYCYSKRLDDCVFFVPKVICDSNDKVLGKCSPEECIDLTNSKLDNGEIDFIQELSIWIYRALKEYSKIEESSKILQEQSFSLVGTAGNTVRGTLLDKILALVKFYEENRDFFIFTMKNIHSQQHRINWNKTISHSQAFIQDETPLYHNPISRKKTVNWDEELMIIFFSILESVKKYGFNIRSENNYDLIKGESFDAFRAGLGTRRLRQIKHRYFSDKTRKLWSLCYAFFDTAETIVSSKLDTDFLIATSFHVAFEAMVDDLIGQPELNEMRELDDGKIIDHIYKDTSLLSNDLVYYIGDSKYYQTSSSVKERSTSAYKQYTYARNVVHDSIVRSFQNTWPFRDSTTEGYCITPNFFISAEIDPSLQFDIDGFDKTDVIGRPFSSRQFNNRLFDRDTLWVNQYNLNFLYLLSTYASANYGLKEDFKKKAHRFFRNQTIKLMNKEYEFWILKPKRYQELKDALTDSIKWGLRGVVYSLDKYSMILAMEKPDEPRNDEDICLTKYERIEVFNRIKPLVEENFYHKRCILSKEKGVVFEYKIPQKVFYSFDEEDF